jgi:hypothetical protein
LDGGAGALDAKASARDEDLSKALNELSAKQKELEDEQAKLEVLKSNYSMEERQSAPPPRRVTDLRDTVLPPFPSCVRVLCVWGWLRFARQVVCQVARMGLHALWLS